MNIVGVIAEAWSWKGLRPRAVIDQNAFGNLIVLDEEGKYWRICPEELSCAIVAQNEDEYVALRANSEFEVDWQMERLSNMALYSMGPAAKGRCYCLKMPGVLGGDYDLSNIGTVPLEELISFAGDVARQIDGRPDGAKVRLVIGRRPV